MLQPNICITKIWVMTRHQYVIFALVTQTFMVVKSIVASRNNAIFFFRVRFSQVTFCTYTVFINKMDI